MSDKIVFSLRNVNYGHVLQVEQADIIRGEITCLVGASGSGKTTFLKLLNNMITPTKGDLYFNNAHITSYNPAELRRQVMMLPQSPVNYPGTIWDNFLKGFEFSGRNLFDISETDDLLAPYLDLVSLSHKNLTQDVSNLSGGEKQRLALARVLLLDPDVLLLDEPFSSMDVNLQNKVMNNLLEYIKSSNKTLVMVSHSPELLKNFDGKVIKFSDGEIL